MKNKTFHILKAFLVVVFLVVFPHLVPLPFYSYAIVCLLVLYFCLRHQGGIFRHIGLLKKGFTLRAVAIGILSALAWVGFMQLLYIPLIKHLFIVPDYTEYNFIRENPATLIMTITAAWLIGGFYEEIVFRGYIQNLLQKRIVSRFSIAISILLTSLLFGLYHCQQDIYGIVAAVLGGLFWGILYKKVNNNLWIPVISHAIFDTITLVLIYTDRFGHF